MKGRVFRFAGVVGIVVFAAVMSTGCFKAEAKTPAAAPALETPEPPDRVVFPVTLDPPPAPIVPTPTPTPTPRPTPTPAAGRGATPPPTTPPATTTPPTDPPTPPPVLQTAPLGELASQAKDRYDRADQDLKRISPNALSKNARGQYDSATRFVRLAKEAMEAKNYVYAMYCADKALSITSLLK